MNSKAIEAAGQFALPGPACTIAPFGSGLIHHTFLVTCKSDFTEKEYILQQMNDQVFQQPLLVMENIQRVTEHLGKKRATRIESGGDRRESLTLVLSKDGKPCIQDPDGIWWRMYEFIDRSLTYDTVDDPMPVFEAAKAFGEFLKDLADFPSPPLHEVIPDFHNTPKRYRVFEAAAEQDAFDRVRLACTEVEFARKYQSLASGVMDLLDTGRIPLRVTHNDTKVNNVLLDKDTGKGLCVIDLDTVMPGSALFDFGDMVRTMTCSAEEDCQDLEQVKIQIPLFSALAEGYLFHGRDILNAEEKASLVLAGKVICYEQGLRFLTDFLSGDTYYRVKYPEHNLVRCRTQFALLASIIQQESDLQRIVERFV